MTPDQQIRSTTGTSFFGVIKEPRSYRTILFLLLGLPLGTFYFTVLVTGVSVGISMLIVALVGIPILIGLWYVVRGFIRFERTLAMNLLGVDIAPLAPVPETTGGLWTRFKALMAHRPTWRGFWYLFLWFFAGVATFTIAVTLIAVSLGLTFGPTFMWISDDLTWGSWTFDPYPWSFALVPLGILLVFVSLHVMNALGAACGQWARWSLGDDSVRPEESHEQIRVDLTAHAASDADIDQTAKEKPVHH